MTTQSFYKIKVRENVLRQMIFTDFNLIAGCVITVSFCSFYFLQMIPLQFRFFLALILNGGILTFPTIKVDNQRVITIAPRAIKYFFRKKHVRF